MVDVRRNDRPAERDLTAHELRGDDLGNGRAETLAGMLLVGDVTRARLVLHGLVGGLPAEVLADGDVLHFGRDDALLRVP